MPTKVLLRYESTRTNLDEQHIPSLSRRVGVSYDTGADMWTTNRKLDQAFLGNDVFIQYCHSMPGPPTHYGIPVPLTALVCPGAW